jgi:nucleoside recognition membrane protein YjiH
MREALDQWDFVIAAYAISVAATLALVVWSWLAMKRAERRREEARGR